MARQTANSSLPAKLLGQAIAVFIFLSVTGDCLQCYWCGPLAEQVHRSQRAPSCEENATNVTACEPGYTHCAVVASSPPLVESRYCVKFYQDECYTLYCGTTKTYRTICPCRGELCNGPNTQREIDAFAALSNTVAKTNNNRIQKRNTMYSHLLNNIDKHRTSNLVENDQDETTNPVDIVTKTEIANDGDMPTDQPTAGEHENANANDSNPREAYGTDSNDSETHNTDTNTNEAHDTESPAHEEPVEITKMPESSNIEADKKQDNNNEIEAVPGVEELQQTELTMTSPTEATTKAIEIKTAEENTIESNEIKPSLEQPTAEALQQDASPVTTEKPMEHTVTVTDATTHMTTMENNEKKAPNTTKSSKNSSIVYSLTLFVLLICLTTNVTL